MPNLVTGLGASVFGAAVGCGVVISATNVGGGVVGGA